MKSPFREVFKGRRILVTGDTGFKGSWLGIWLNELGAEVFGYSLPPKTADDNYVRSGLSKKINHQDGDIRDLDALVTYCRDTRPEIAFHLAAQSLVLPSYENPVETFHTNTLGTVHFLEAVRRTPSIKVAVNVTSDKCYQNHEWERGYHEGDAMGGDDPYSASKGCAELITHAFAKSFFSSANCLIASARAGNVIGGGDWADHRIIPDIFRAYFSGKELVIRNPEATRPWQFVLEPVFGYLSLAAALLNKGKDFAGAWNFGPEATRTYKVLDIIQAIRTRLPDLKTKVDAATAKPHEAKLLRLDISKAIAKLEWKPLLSFDEMIDFTVDGYRAQQKPDDLYTERVKQISQYISKF